MQLMPEEVKQQEVKKEEPKKKGPLSKLKEKAEDDIRDFCLSRGLGDVYKRQISYSRK